MKNEFSVPMPALKRQIDKIVAINEEVEKSSITSLYFALPANCPNKTGFEQLRTYDDEANFEFYLDKISYAKEKGFDFIYLLNTAKEFLTESNFFEQQLEKLDILINRLRNIGCNTYRVGNPQLIAYLENNYPDVRIYASTSLEYKSLRQYSNFFSLHKSVEEIVPAVDMNKNFKFIENLHKEFPDIIIELMVNEGCVPGCPLRYTHNISHMYSDAIPPNILDEHTLAYFFDTCSKKLSADPFIELCNPNIIYPWEIEEYNNIGIRNFKLVGRDCGVSFRDTYIDYYRLYLLGVDNYKNIENEPINIFNRYIVRVSTPYRVKDVRFLLPNIKHFKKQGYLCSSICGVECNYCKKCAKKVEKLFAKL